MERVTVNLGDQIVRVTVNLEGEVQSVKVIDGLLHVKVDGVSVGRVDTLNAVAGTNVTLASTKVDNQVNLTINSAAGGGDQNISQVLAVGNDANEAHLINLGSLNNVIIFRKTLTVGIFLGVNVGNNTHTGVRNVVLGSDSGQALTSGHSNTLLGAQVGNAITIAIRNVAVGRESLNANISGNFNVAVGRSTLRTGTSPTGNTALGYEALEYCNGGNNIGIGFHAGNNNPLSGNNNVLIGAEVQAQNDTASNQMSILNAIFGVGNVVVNGFNKEISNGNIGFYVVAPSARVHLPAGQADSGKGALKLTSGVNLTTPEDGAVEFDGSNLYITINGVRYELNASAKRIESSVSSGTLTLNMASMSQKRFSVVDTISSNITLALSNTNNSELFGLHLKVTGAIDITLPSTFRMSADEVDSGRYDFGTRVLTLTGTTDQPFELSGAFDGSVWLLKATKGFV